MNLEEIQRLIHTKLLVLRNIETFVNTEKFESSCELANKEQMFNIEQNIIWSNYKALVAIVNQIIYNNSDIGNMSMRQLRVLAKKYKITGYNFLPKSSLLSMIKTHESIIKSDGRNVDESKNTPRPDEECAVNV